MEDTFKDIAVYSTLAMILFRKDQEKNRELTAEEEICKICPSCGEENRNGVELGNRFNGIVYNRFQFNKRL